MKTREFCVPVPWGQVAVKAWGEEDNFKVLVVHGLEDNAAGFDNLIPLLPKHFYYVCIDLPGHGKSSHFPPHTPLYVLDFVLTLRLVTNYFKWDRYAILSHSMGSMSSTMFALLYPEKVEKLINIDGLLFYPIKPKNMVKYVSTKLENLLKLEKNTEEVPGLSYPEILDKFIKRRTTFPIQKKAAEILLTRSLLEVGDKQYTLSTDERISLCLLRPLYDIPYIIKSYHQRPLTCPVLIILADQNKYQIKTFDSFIKTLKKQKNVQVKLVKGDHCVHMHNPERVAPIISKFLCTPIKSKL